MRPNRPAFVGFRPHLVDPNGADAKKHMCSKHPRSKHFAPTTALEPHIVQRITLVIRPRAPAFPERQPHFGELVPWFSEVGGDIGFVTPVRCERLARRLAAAFCPVRRRMLSAHFDIAAVGAVGREARVISCVFFEVWSTDAVAKRIAEKTFVSRTLYMKLVVASLLTTPSIAEREVVADSNSPSRKENGRRRVRSAQHHLDTPEPGLSRYHIAQSAPSQFQFGGSRGVFAAINCQLRCG